MREKLTFSELCNVIHEHNNKQGVTQQFEDKDPLTCRIVYKSETWPHNNFTEEERTYEFRSDNKYFLPSMIGNSIFADCLDGQDKGVRLDWYFGQWKIDYCYII